MGHATAEALAFLNAELANGPVLCRELRASSDDAGISWTTLKIAKRRRGVVSTKTGGTGAPWQWGLPEATAVEIEALRALAADRGIDEPSLLDLVYAVTGKLRLWTLTSAEARLVAFAVEADRR